MISTLPYLYSGILALLIISLFEIATEDDLIGPINIIFIQVKGKCKFVKMSACTCGVNEVSQNCILFDIKHAPQILSPILLDQKLYVFHGESLSHKRVTVDIPSLVILVPGDKTEPCLVHGLVQLRELNYQSGQSLFFNRFSK